MQVAAPFLMGQVPVRLEGETDVDYNGHDAKPLLDPSKTTWEGRSGQWKSATCAQLESWGIRERLEPGIDGDRKQGPKAGRPSVWTREGFSERFGGILERLSGGDISRCQAAKELGIGYATLKRLLDARASDHGGVAG